MAFRAPRASPTVMPKPLLYLLAALPLLLAALVLGRARAPRGCEPHALKTTKTTIHVRAVRHAHARAALRTQARAALHASSHGRMTIDDDDEYDGEDDVETAMLAPRQQDKNNVASDVASDEHAANADRPALTTTVAALRMTGRGIRPSGEHRSAADRPPRS